MPGAPVLSAEAALATGAGLVTVAHPAATAVSMLRSEIMLAQCSGRGGEFLAANIDKIGLFLQKSTAVALGPGIGQSEQAFAFCKAFLSLAAKSSLPIVIDADALNAISSFSVKPDCSNASWIFTPHPGEAASLLKKSTAEIQANRYASASQIAKDFNVICVLKGASTVVASEERIAVNVCDTPLLATAGSGDVLAGVIASLLAAGVPAFEAAKTGVFLHGLAGRVAGKKSALSRIIASDVIDSIGEATSCLRSACAGDPNG
jgi:NAD(P)H-hydrate epimerase